jgi:thiol-disulfide isomerase/thioredoxin
MKHFLILAAFLALTFLACTNSDDALYDESSNSSISISAKLLLEKDSLSRQGKADTVMLTLIYSPKYNELGALFFAEPGTIRVKMSQTEGNSTIGGTKANEGLQELNTLTSEYGKKMQEIVAVLYDPNASEENKQQALLKEQQLRADLTTKVIEAAEKNIDNELGFFLITSFSDDETFTPEKRRELIGKMPKAFRERNEIKGLEQMLDASETISKGNAIPSFTLPTPEGGSLNIMDEVAKNKVTILDFWASWCGPCRQEMPLMVELYKEYKEQGLGIVGISLDDNKEAWVKAIEELNLTWPQISDLKGWKSAAAELFNVTAIPFTIIVDQQGNILKKELRGEELKQFIAQQLK